MLGELDMELDHPGTVREPIGKYWRSTKVKMRCKSKLKSTVMKERLEKSRRAAVRVDIRDLNACISYLSRN